MRWVKSVFVNWKKKKKKKTLMGMIEPRGEEILQEKWRITAVVVLEWMSVGGIQDTGKGLGLASSRTVHPW